MMKYSKRTHVQTSKIVIADDHGISRAGLRMMCDRLPHATVIAEASNGIEAIRFTKQHQPELLILDIAMPFAKGIEVVTEVRRWAPYTRILIVTGMTSMGLLNQMHIAKVDGIVLKSGDHHELTLALTTILAGGKFIAKSVEARLKNSHQQAPLTRREMQTLSMIADGRGNAEIATALSISPKTVDNHRTNLMRKIGAHTVSQLISYALREGLLEDHLQL